MEYIYCFANASLTIRLIEYLNNKMLPYLDSISVIHLLDSWIIKLKMKTPFTSQQDGDFRAYLNEIGIAYNPNIIVKMALYSLEQGLSPVEVMHCFQIVVVSHGYPQREEIDCFRQKVIEGLGYCPKNLT